MHNEGCYEESCLGESGQVRKIQEVCFCALLVGGMLIFKHGWGAPRGLQLCTQHGVLRLQELGWRAYNADTLSSPIK